MKFSIRILKSFISTFVSNVTLAQAAKENMNWILHIRIQDMSWTMELRKKQLILKDVNHFAKPIRNVNFGPGDEMVVNVGWKLGDLWLKGEKRSLWYQEQEMLAQFQLYKCLPCLACLSQLLLCKFILKIKKIAWKQCAYWF